ncbi:MAG: hypothetical protein MMC33_000221 [Icmadophila ericetorum]|nr:hypothetical protein [Icmadophila ericetorum]
MGSQGINELELQVDYTSPQEKHTFAHKLPSMPGEPTTKERTSYLSSLRASVVKLQEEVNEFLTAKMEEDKLLASNATGKVDEKKEEENYGEEVVNEG